LGAGWEAGLGAAAVEGGWDFDDGVFVIRCRRIGCRCMRGSMASGGK